MSDPVEMYRTPWQCLRDVRNDDEIAVVVDNRTQNVFDIAGKGAVTWDHFVNAFRVITCVNFLSTAQDDILGEIFGSPVHQMILGLLSGDKEMATLAAQSVADAILGDEPGLIWKGVVK